MKKKERKCTICGNVLSRHNPKKTCFYHEYRTDHDPEGDALRRNKCTSGSSGNMAVFTFAMEHGRVV